MIYNLCGNTFLFETNFCIKRTTQSLSRRQFQEPFIAT